MLDYLLIGLLETYLVKFESKYNICHRRKYRLIGCPFCLMLIGNKNNHACWITVLWYLAYLHLFMCVLMVYLLADRKTNIPWVRLIYLHVNQVLSFWLSITAIHFNLRFALLLFSYVVSILCSWMSDTFNSSLPGQNDRQFGRRHFQMRFHVW